MALQAPPVTYNTSAALLRRVRIARHVSLGTSIIGVQANQAH